jgi:hypothetical protein
MTWVYFKVKAEKVDLVALNQAIYFAQTTYRSEQTWFVFLWQQIRSCID